MNRLGVGIASCLLLAGCGHDSSSGSGFESAADVAAAIGCAPFTPGPTAAPSGHLTGGTGSGWSVGTKIGGFEDGTCVAHGERIHVLWSTSPNAAYRFAFDLGPAPQRPKTWLHTSVWVVHCRTEATCRLFQHQLGGTLG